MKLEDTPEFEEMTEKQQVTKSPLLDTVTKNPWSVARGTAPYVAAQLVESTGNAMSPAYWVVGVCAIGLLTVATIRETSRKEPPA
ncbi:hypothetical protein [Nocardia donostiensis]|uniref:MFS transporter n=1 Tax=Nocardia donostiensis TaxID=1538463 RepID=A0A1W0BI78_9NOCA|nr:hypothetical protein B0T46_05635 [Nocardia donostiensis]OQS13438.1 hypothetical protein B0T36_20340 [Nocardia donostiensis]OQS22183.1 hypothetical protein B0T44_05905 [Nocardia donostiensis]